MAGRLELGFQRTGVCSLKEQLARSTLNIVRLQGHPYVELREEGKRLIFFCTLCLAPCYSDSVLFDHLKGSLHAERLSAAKLTLLKPNPWPFSDGIHFFDNSSENGKQSDIKKGDQIRLLESQSNGNSLAIVEYEGDGIGEDNRNLNSNGGTSDIVIPHVVVKDEISNLKARFVGCGKIAARFLQKGKVPKEISRIWCEWLGENASDDEEKAELPDHEFGIVTFSYNYDLGRKGLLDDVKLLLSSSPEHGERANKKRRKSFSDPEDVSESLSHQYDSSSEGSSASNGGHRLLLEHLDGELLHSRFIASKTVRRELRRQQRIAAERMCDICQQKMLPEKDVATLVNMKTGKLACSSRNVNGAFHVFHASCLIHWMLLCEYEIVKNHPFGLKARRRSRRKNGSKASKTRKTKAWNNQIETPFCPECQGTGAVIDGETMERPTIPLSEMFKYKMKVSDGRRAWIKSPELLQNCSIGFHSPSESEETAQEKVMPLKLLNFYKAEE